MTTPPAAAPAQRPLSSYFGGSVIFTLICLALGAAYGWNQTGTAGGTLALLWIVVVLSVLEISLSFDNAVVNAAVLETMDPVWRRRFLTWGMVIAVFGMRVLFPLAIVGIAAQLGPTDALRLSLNPQSMVSSRTAVLVTLVVGAAWLVTAVRLGHAGFTGLFLVVALALTWLAVIAGLSAKSVDGAGAFAYPLIFLPFVSSAFVLTATMPAPVRACTARTARSRRCPRAIGFRNGNGEAPET